MAKKIKNEKDIFKVVQYPGGNQAMIEFLTAQQQYPAEAVEKGIEGTVHVKYDIDYKGKVIDVKIIQGIGGGCDEEAIRMVKLLEFEPTRNRGLRVTFHKKLQIHFRKPLTPAEIAPNPLPPTPQADMQVQYTFAPKQPASSDSDNHQKLTYRYVVTV